MTLYKVMLHGILFLSPCFGADESKRITQGDVEKTIKQPDSILSASRSRNVYQRVLNRKMLRVVVESNHVLAAYLTYKERYLRPE